MDGKNIYLLRHGEIEGAGEKRYIGISDVPLSERGVAQAQALRAFFEGLKIDMCYCSDLKRTVQTAGIIMGGRSDEIIRLSEIREVNMGLWEGRSFNEIKRSFPDEFERRIHEIETFKPNGGESFSQCQKRAVNSFDVIIRGKGKNILVAAHAGVNRLIIAHLLEIPMGNIFSFRQDYACINNIKAGGKSCTVNYLNRTL